MRYRVKKDKQVRKKAVKSEELLNCLRFLRSFCIIPEETRFRLFSAFDKKGGSGIRIVNRCTKTGVSRSVYRDYRVSRQTLRLAFLGGTIVGIRKSSW
jgi:ribosomal protein S14